MCRVRCTMAVLTGRPSDGRPSEVTGVTEPNAEHVQAFGATADGSQPCAHSVRPPHAQGLFLHRVSALCRHPAYACARGAVALPVALRLDAGSIAQGIREHCPSGDLA